MRERDASGVEDLRGDGWGSMWEKPELSGGLDATKTPVPTEMDAQGEENGRGLYELEGNNAHDVVGAR